MQKYFRDYSFRTVERPLGVLLSPRWRKHVTGPVLAVSLFLIASFTAAADQASAAAAPVQVSGAAAPLTGDASKPALPAISRPEPAAMLQTLEQALDISDVTVEEMLAQMLLIGFRGLGPGEAEYAADYRAFRDFISQGKAGGVILFNRDHSSGSRVRNILSPAQLTALCADLQEAAPVPLFIAVDQEGGRVRRLTGEAGFSDLPSPAEMGRLKVDSVYWIAKELGLELRALGVNVDFAPSLDLNVNPENPVIGSLGRSFGADPRSVASYGRFFMSGLNEVGILGSYKHFPGHGSSRSDTHVEFTDITRSWSDQELEPYRELLEPRGPYMVMLGHLFHQALDPVYPASLSPAIATGLLRKKLGWQGVIISDDLQMKAIADHYGLEETIRLAIEAGNDIVLFGNNLAYDPQLPEKAHQAMLKLHRDGKISRERIEQSYRRIMSLKAWLTLQHQSFRD